MVRRLETEFDNTKKSLTDKFKVDVKYAIDSLDASFNH